jgi:hypothetical protein
MDVFIENIPVTILNCYENITRAPLGGALYARK